MGKRLLNGSLVHSYRVVDFGNPIYFVACVAHGGLRRRPSVGGRCHHIRQPRISALRRDVGGQGGEPSSLDVPIGAGRQSAIALSPQRPADRREFPDAPLQRGHALHGARCSGALDEEQFL